MNTSKFIAICTGFLTLSLALFSFILSFNALTELATEHGVSIPWLLPFLVEFGVVTFSLAAMYRSVNGESAVWQWTLVIGSSLVAGTFNVAHSQPDLLSRVIAAMPSLFLLASFETFLSQVKYQFKRQSTLDNLDKLTSDFAGKEATFDRQLERMRDSLRQRFANERTKLDKTLSDLESKLQNVSADLDKLTGQIARKEQKLAELNADIKQQNAVNVSELQQKRLAKKAEREQRALQLFAEGLTEVQIAEALNIKDVRTIRGYLQQAQNGNGAK